MNGASVLVMALAVALLLALPLLGWALYRVLHGPRARLERRIQQVVGDKSARTGGGRTATARKRALQLRIQAEGQKGRWAWRLREQLGQAGVRIEVRQYIGGCLGIAVLVALAAWMLGQPALTMLLAAAIIGFGIPKLVLARLARRRITKFTALFADALDVVVRGMRSGLPLTECINIIGREMPDPLGAEFRLVTEGQKLGLSLQESLERVLERNPTPDFRYFTIVLAIQQQTGGNLAETLAKLSELLRGRARMRDKIKAYSSEATASALIIGSLPLVVAALLLVVSHEYVMVLFNTEAGNVLLVIGALMMGAGALIMRKMISFDI
jgi:tight adherence protein B